MKYHQPLDKADPLATGYDPNASYIDAVPNSGQEGSIIPAAAVEQSQREIVKTITDVGLAAPSDTDLTQLSSATRFMRLQYLQDTGSANAIFITMNPGPPAWATPLSFFVKMAFTNTQRGITFGINGVAGTKPVVKRDGVTQLRIDDLQAGTVYLFMYDGTSVRVMSYIFSDLPVVPLTHGIDIYVSDAIGSDTLYDGRSPTISGEHGPFKTIQRGLNESTFYNLNGYNITVNCVGAQTYNVAVGCEFPPINGSGFVILYGNGSTINCTAGHALGLRVPGYMRVDGMKLKARGVLSGNANSAIWVSIGRLDVFNCEFQGAINYHMNVTDSGWITFGGTITINDAFGCAGHMYCGSGGRYYGDSSAVLTVSQLVTFSDAFVVASDTGHIQVIYGSITNGASVSGPRFRVDLNGVINTGGRGTSYFPGNSVPTFPYSLGGQYG